MKLTHKCLLDHNACAAGIAWWMTHGKPADVDSCIQSLVAAGNWSYASWVAREACWTGTYVVTGPDGYYYEERYLDGKFHCDDGPAVIETCLDGSHYEEWYREGKHYRADGPTRVVTRPNSYRREEWYRDGV